MKAPGELIGSGLCAGLSETHLEWIAVKQGTDLASFAGEKSFLEQGELLVDERIIDPHAAQVDRGNPARLELGGLRLYPPR